MSRIVFLILFAVSAFLPPAAALFGGIIYALLLTNPLPGFSGKISKYMLQAAVVGLGFGMNLHSALETGREGMLFTIVSVAGVMILGCLLGRCMKTAPKLSYLIASGTAICGGSAIAAVSPIIKADRNETSMALAVVFTLNAVALFLFPLIGHTLNLDQQQFGMWAAIAIHDTSSVVGAGATYGPEALALATTVKLTRALWIIPLSIVSAFVFPSRDKKHIAVPWFIFLFLAAMIANSCLNIPGAVTTAICTASHWMLSATLFLIGSTLSTGAVKAAGLKPVALGITLWMIISISTLIVVLWK